MIQNKIILFIIAAFLLTACASRQQDQLEGGGKLHIIDSIINLNPTLALNQLDSINPENISVNNLPYYELLNIIAQENNFIKIKSDSSILWVYDYYKNLYKADSSNRKTAYNYARAALYYAVIKSNLQSKDTLLYTLYKDALVILDQYGANYYKALANSRLAVINNNYKDLYAAEYYYQKAFEDYRQLGATQMMALLKVDRALFHLISRRYDLVIQYLKEIEDENLLTNDDIKFAYYSAYAAYYAVQRNYSLAVEYAKKQKELKSGTRRGIDYSKINYSISKYYSFLNKPDSALVYAQMAIDTAVLTQTASEKLQNYYRNIGDIYLKNKEFYQSSVAYRKAFFHSLNSTSEFHKKRQREIEKKYSISLANTQKGKMQAEKWASIFFHTILVLAFLLATLLLIYKMRIGKITKKNMELRQNALEQELQQSKAMIDIVSLSLGVLPTFIEKVNDLSAKIFSSDPLLYDGFQKEIHSVKTEIRKRLLDLVNDQAIVHSNPILKHLDTLSNQEKIIVLLLRQRYSAKYAASILNISQSSIRASKVKIKNKIIATEMDDTIKTDILSGLQ